MKHHPDGGLAIPTCVTPAGERQPLPRRSFGVVSVLITGVGQIGAFVGFVWPWGG